MVNHSPYILNFRISTSFYGGLYLQDSSIVWIEVVSFTVFFFLFLSGTSSVLLAWDPCLYYIFGLRVPGPCRQSKRIKPQTQGKAGLRLWILRGDNFSHTKSTLREMSLLSPCADCQRQLWLYTGFEFSLPHLGLRSSCPHIGIKIQVPWLSRPANPVWKVISSPTPQIIFCISTQLFFFLT